MLSDDIKRLGSRIASDLDQRQASPADKWMSHYIAEQMKLSETARTKKERQAAADRCAELIPRLWDKRIDIASYHLRSRISDLLRPSADHSKWSRGLASLLSDGFSRKRRPPRKWDERVGLLWELCRVEEMLILMLSLAIAVKQEDDEEVAEEVGKRVMDNETVFSFCLDGLRELFPTEAKLKVSNSQQVKRFSQEALRRIHALRSELL